MHLLKKGCLHNLRPFLLLISSFLTYSLEILLLSCLLIAQWLPFYPSFGSCSFKSSLPPLSYPLPLPQDRQQTAVNTLAALVPTGPEDLTASCSCIYLSLTSALAQGQRAAGLGEGRGKKEKEA